MKWIYCWFMNEMNFNPRSPQFNFNLKWNAANARIEFHIKINWAIALASNQFEWKNVMNWMKIDVERRRGHLRQLHSINCFHCFFSFSNSINLLSFVERRAAMSSFQLINSTSAGVSRFISFINCWMKEKNGTSVSESLILNHFVPFRSASRNDGINWFF